MKTTKPTKQRKRMYTAPITERYRRFSAPLSSKLKDSHGTNSVQVRNGDTVMIMRGDRKGSEGKITRIDRKNFRIFIEGATREKMDGTSIPVHVHPSKVMITRLNLDDKWRKKTLERKAVSENAEIAKKEPPKKEAKKKKQTSKVTKQSGGT
jgi:large subunit ribosomal protein L24